MSGVFTLFVWIYRVSVCEYFNVYTSMQLARADILRIFVYIYYCVVVADCDNYISKHDGDDDAYFVKVCVVSKHNFTQWRKHSRGVRGCT